MFGLVLAGCAYAVSPALFLWMSPVLLGLLLAVPLASLTASRGAGHRAAAGSACCGSRRSATRPRCSPAPARCSANRATRRRPTRSARLLRDPALIAAHVAMLPPPRRRGDPIDVPLLVGLARLAEADSLEAAGAALSPAEKAAVLANADGVAQLCHLAGLPVPVIAA